MQGRKMASLAVVLGDAMKMTSLDSSCTYFFDGCARSDYEFTIYTFCCSNMLLSIAYFAWGRVIIYDDNLSCRNLSQAKRKIYLFSFISFLKERSMVKRGCSLSGLGAFKQHFLNEIYLEQFAVHLHEAF